MNFASSLSRHSVGDPTASHEFAWHEALDTELVLGAVNLQQDLHFAALYLRASLTASTEPLYPGYRFVLAVYEKDVERYYLPAEDTERTAQWLIQKSAAEPRWLGAQLASIERQSAALDRAFPDGLSSVELRAAGADDLLTLYLRHQKLHAALYHVARLPEALDRGAPFFTDFLRNRLRASGVGEADLPFVFEALTCPSTPSVFAEEQTEFDEISGGIAAACPGVATAYAPELLIEGRLRDALRRHRERWGFLSYHGYRNRSLPTEADSMRRLKAALRSGAASERRARRIDNAAVAAKGLPPLDSALRELLRLHGEIGRVKLHRRYHQLRNFYYLDLLLAEIARRLDSPEWLVRCCLPEELVSALVSGRIDPRVSERLDFCAIFYSGERACVVTGPAHANVLQKLKLKAAAEPPRHERRGSCACSGFARGRARLIGWGGNVPAEFQPGNVLICEAADPDLLPLLRIASAVVTQQGGVTSHASVLCRELGVPTVIGIDDLLNFVRDGDDVEVNASAGIVTRLEATQAGTRASLVIPQSAWVDAEIVGGKAAEMERARRLGLRMPPFTLLSWQGLRKTASADGARLARLLQSLAEGLRPAGEAGGSFMLRSSARGENDSSNSMSGRFISVACSFGADSQAEIQRFISVNEAQNYCGAVILQWRVPVANCGVSVEGDRRIGLGDKLVIELVPGSVNTVTQGRGRPVRLIFDRNAGEFEHSCTESFPADGRLLDWLGILRDAFGTPTYAEWGFYRGEYWLFQIRGEYHDRVAQAVSPLSLFYQREAVPFQGPARLAWRADEAAEMQQMRIEND